MMEREIRAPRENFPARLAEQGLSFHGAGNYWKEDACYRFTTAQVNAIEMATAELHAMCVQAMHHLVAGGRLDRLGIPPAFWQGIGESARRADFSLYGRFDLVYDGQSPPKLLEYNADTPTSLLESSVCQWYWLQDCYPQFDQFNSIHEKLVAQWRALPGTGGLTLACVDDNEEDWVCVTYLRDTAVQAGRAAQQMGMDQIGWDAARKVFVDLEGTAIENLFKLYPWEWLMRDQFAQQAIDSKTKWLEAPWKMILSNKAILPVLWELFPGHPNLLPASFTPLPGSFVRKPVLSREGANIVIQLDGQTIQETPGKYDGPYVYQQYQPLPTFDSNHPMIGSWMVNGYACGIGIREDTSLVTGNLSRFVPHLFT